MRPSAETIAVLRDENSYLLASIFQRNELKMLIHKNKFLPLGLLENIFYGAN